MHETLCNLEFLLPDTFVAATISLDFDLCRHAHCFVQPFFFLDFIVLWSDLLSFNFCTGNRLQKVFHAAKFFFEIVCETFDTVCNGLMRWTTVDGDWEGLSVLVWDSEHYPLMIVMFDCWLMKSCSETVDSCFSRSIPKASFSNQPRNFIVGYSASRMISEVLVNFLNVVGFKCPH